MSICFQSLGCRLNQAEIEDLAHQFATAGHTISCTPGEADLCIVNTCAVTAQAERKSRYRIRSVARANPHVRIAVIGCYASQEPQRCADLPGVVWVVPNSEKEHTMDIVCASPSSRLVPAQSATEKSPDFQRTRAFVKVQDGCDNHCTYCITRLLRGAAQSRPLADLIAHVQMMVASGHQEVVLTGANLGSYGRDLGLPGGLRMLVEALLAHTDVSRLRLSSLEPWDVDEAFFELWADARLCRQLHLPLQAGCDEILQRMGRHVTTEEFARLVKVARAAIPDLAVTTDIIVGFPGEDEAAFRNSHDFVVAMEFARLHVFPYSPRPGTAATHLSGQIPRDMCLARARLMRGLGTEQASRFRRRFIGREMTVLWERRRRDGLWSGLTDNYLRVVTDAEHDLHNRTTVTRLLATQGDCMLGETIE